MRALPDFPWDSLVPYRERALAYAPDVADERGTSLVDLSIGTPIDPTPEPIQEALAAAADAPGYPQVYGTPDLREAVAAWFAARRGVPALDPAGVMPTIGSKELVAWLPTLLGIGPGERVAVPPVAYPTYRVGALLAGADPIEANSLLALGPQTERTRPSLIWVNSPSNPTGAVLGVEHLAKVVTWAREHGVIVASDECYAELDWRSPVAGEAPSTVSILDPRVCGGSHDGLLAVYSLSKQSNLAGYRAAFVAGDPTLVNQLVQIRKHAGMIMPWPVQRAMIAALRDFRHVQMQRLVYGRRRAALKPAVEAWGLRVDDSEAGLYLWATADEDCWSTTGALADLGILAAPGSFYGDAGGRHVRIALTASDERISAAVARLGGK